MQVTVQIKDQYGTRVIYPVCTTGQLFARIAGTKTLTPRHIESIKALGYSVQVEQPVLSL